MSGVVRTLSRCLLPAEAGGARERRAAGGGARDAEREARRRSRDIDAGLARERRAVRRLVKILLLGAGESGKSTFLKQMRIIHGQDFDQRAREEFRPTIYSNVIKGAGRGSEPGDRGSGLRQGPRPAVARAGPGTALVRSVPVEGPGPAGGRAGGEDGGAPRALALSAEGAFVPQGRGCPGAPSLPP